VELQVSYCDDCGAKFGGDWEIGSFRCPACKRRRQEEDAEADRENRRQAEEERRHAALLQADEDRFARMQELEAERARNEELRQQDAKWEAEERERRREEAKEAALSRQAEQHEALLERQREQLANAWRFEAESKLQQADRLHRAGALRDALALALQTTALGQEARRLVGWIHRDFGERGKYIEQLALQIDLLAIDNAPATAGRILEEVSALGNEREPLLVRYFAACQQWTRFPYEIRPVLAKNGLLGHSLFRALLVKHVQAIAAIEQEAKQDQYGNSFLHELLSVPDSEALIDQYASATKKWKFFAVNAITFLLVNDQAKAANTVFENTRTNVPEAQSDAAYVWDVCPLGMELYERGVQPKQWSEKFRNAIEALPFEKIVSTRLREALDSRSLSTKTKSAIQTVMAAKGQATLEAQSVEVRKSPTKASVAVPEQPWYQNPLFFAGTFLVLYIYHVWSKDWFNAVGSGIVVFFGGLALKQWSNERHDDKVRLVNWFEKRRTEIAATLHLKETDDLKISRTPSRPNQGTRFFADAFYMCLLSVVVLACLRLYEGHLYAARGLVGSSAEWTRDWRAEVSTGNRWTSSTMTVRLDRSSEGRMVVKFFENRFILGAKDDPTSVITLRKCKLGGATLTCEGSLAVVGSKQFSAVPSRVFLFLDKGTGVVESYLPNEPAMKVQLFETPASTTDVPGSLLGK
jgi:hypothetical protein